MADYQFRTAAYLRLSKGDGDVDGAVKNESNSISNQRLLIDRFLQENPEFQLVETYIDDGYTGTNFERPGMQRMLEDIDRGKLDCVLVKDLSRFGRERIETGTFIQKTFKEKGVRFIAINDNYDSLTATSSENHLVMPIKAMTNEYYSMDTSAKIRASQKVKREKGEFIGAYAAYGYQKDPQNKNHLIVDPVAAEVVKDIFAKKIAGYSGLGICKYLQETGVLTPSNYKKAKDPNMKIPSSADKCKWTPRTVLRILENELYIGSVVQGRTQQVSYKVRKRIDKPKEDWDIVPNMHEPIISEDDFAIVQSLLKRDTMKGCGQRVSYLFSGMLFCGDCGRSLTRRVRKYPTRTHIEYLCNGYLKDHDCSSHKIIEEDLFDIVKSSINHMIYKLCRYSELADNLKNLRVSQEEAVNQNREIKRLREEVKRYETLKQGLYQDVEDGLLSSEMFERFKREYSQQIRQLKRAIETRKKIIEGLYDKGLAADKLIDQFKHYPKVTELNRVLLVSLIDKVLIYEDNKIEIVYRYSDKMAVLDEIMEADKEKGASKDGKNEEQI